MDKPTAITRVEQALSATSPAHRDSVTSDPRLREWLEGKSAPQTQNQGAPTQT